MESKENCIRVLADITQIKRCKEFIHEKNPSFKQLSNILALSGNEVRLKILFLLEEEKELCPCDLADILVMSFPAMSQHLRKLKDGGIIKGRKVAQTIFYSINPGHLELLKRLFMHIEELNLNSEKV